MGPEDATIRTLLIAAIMGAWMGAALWVLWRRPRQPAPAAHPVPAPAPPQSPSREDQPDLARFCDAPSPVWLRDSDLALTYVNAAYAKLAGAVDPYAAVADQAELAPTAKSLAAKARDAGRTMIDQDRVATPAARQMMEFIHIPLARGEVVALAVDGTARHEAANIAARQTRALTEALAQLGSGIALFDPAGGLTSYNPAFERLFHLEAAWLQTRPHFDDLLDAMYEGQRLPETSDFAGWKAERRRWVRLDADPAMETWRLPSGEILTVRAQPRSDGGLVLVVEDETDRIRLAGERVAQLAVHQVTLDHLSEGVAVFGPDGRIRLLNRRAAEVLLVPPEVMASNPSAEMLMDHVQKFLDEPGRAQRLRELILSATAGRQSREGQVLSTLGYQVDYRTVPLPDGNALMVIRSQPVDAAAADAA